MRIFSIAVAAIVLAGCATPEQRAADQATAERSAAYRSRLQDADDNNRCVAYGAQPGTEGYASCRAQLSQMHEMVRETEENRQNAQDEDRKAAIVSQFLANQARQQQDLYDQQMANIRAATQSNRPSGSSHPANCITNYIGDSAYTTCQ